jgi:hypothetical protein
MTTPYRPYRENVKPEDRGEKINRRLDYLLYTGPMRRLGLAIIVALPWGLAGFVGCASLGAPGLVIGLLIYAAGGILPSLVITGLLANAREAQKTEQYVVGCSWWPFTLIYLLARWIVRG